MAKDRQPFGGELEAVVNDGYAALDRLNVEIEDAMESMEEKMSGTQRYQDYEAANDCLADHLEAPDVPEFLKSFAVDYVNDTRARESKTKVVQRNNAVAMIQGALDTVRTWIDLEKDDTTDEFNQACEFAEVLEATVNEVEGLDFS